MTAVPKEIKTWQMVQPTVRDRETGEVTPGKLESTSIPVPELKSGEVLVEIAGCGVCHTDLGDFYDGVPKYPRDLAEDDGHGLYFVLGVSAGLPVLVLLAWVLASSLRRGLAAASFEDVPEGPWHGVALGGAGALAAICVGGLFNEFLTAGLVDELHLVIAPFFVGDSRAPRFVGDGSFPWGPDRRAVLAEVRQIGDVVLLRYALSDRFDAD